MPETRTGGEVAGPRKEVGGEVVLLAGPQLDDRQRPPKPSPCGRARGVPVRPSDIVAGQATSGRELAEQLPDVGGAGAVAGAASRGAS